MAGIFPDSFGFGGGLFGNAFGQPPRPSGFGDLINNNQSAILGYLAGALQGGNLGQSIGRGLQGWQQGQQADLKRQAQSTTTGATYRALMAGGVPDATAQAAALNPDVMHAIAPRYLQKLPTFGVIGRDEFGMPRYGFIDPFNRTTQPAEGRGPAAGPQR